MTLGRLRSVLPNPVRTPFTFWYLVLLLATTIALRSVDTRTEYHVLQWSSTNVAHLRHAPIRAMLASAMVLPGLKWAPNAMIFSLVLAPVERQIGSRWTIAVFASGHVLATLVTELSVAWLVWFGVLPGSWVHILDVGVSYGFFSVLGVLVGLLASRWRWLGLAAAEVLVFGGLIMDVGLASIGHVVALNLGVVLWWRWLAERGVYGTLQLRYVRVPHHTWLGKLYALRHVAMDRNLSQIDSGLLTDYGGCADHRRSTP